MRKKKQLEEKYNPYWIIYNYKSGKRVPNVNKKWKTFNGAKKALDSIEDKDSLIAAEDWYMEHREELISHVIK